MQLNPRADILDEQVHSVLLDLIMRVMDRPYGNNSIATYIHIPCMTIAR